MTIASVGFEPTPHTVFAYCVIHRVAVSVAVPAVVLVRHHRQAFFSFFDRFIDFHENYQIPSKFH